MTTVKITELTNIGANLATSTVVPVVNMAGTPTTQKTTVGNIANLILEGAGTDYPEASVALLAQTVSNAAQPNITSTGTLTTLAVSGNASVNGNLTSNGTAYLGNISTTGSATITTLIVGTTANLGAVGNVKITGGTSGQILSTDGAGNLSWVSDANGGSYGNSNVATYLASYGSNTITTTGNVSVGNIIGNGQALTGIAGANVSGFVPNANVANTAFSVAAANVSGLGNVALVNFDGNSSNVLYGNGVFDGVGSPFNQDLNTTDNVTFANITSTDAIRFSNSSNIVGALGYAPTYVSIEGYGSNSVNITANDIYTWTFDGNGNLTIPNGGYINFVNTGGIKQVVNEDFYIRGSDDEEDGWAIFNIIDDGAGNQLTKTQLQYNRFSVYTDVSGNNYSFDFRDTGEFDVPKSIRGPFGGNLVISIGDQSGSDTFIDLQTRSYVGDALISNIRIANPNVTVSTASGAYNWTFGDTGNLTLPGNTFSVNYANGTQVSIGGGGGNTGNVTFANVTVQGDNNSLNLSAGNSFTANLAYLQVRAGDVASHIHLDTGNNQAYDLFVGDDQNYVQVSSTGNILLSSYDSNTAQYTWTLDYNGNLILAGGNSVIQSIANSSLDPTLPNVSTMVFTPDSNYTSQILVLDPTAPGHIHLRAYASSNIDQPAANIFLGGEDTAFEITSGANNQAVIHSNGKVWTFGNDGNISSDTLTLTTTFANVKTVEYQTAGVWDLYVEDGITGSNTAISRLNVSFKDNLINKPQVYIENTKESDGIALRWTFDENGNLNFPRNVVGNSDPYLSIFGGSTPTIQSTDVSLAGPANLTIQSNYLNLSGFSGDKIVFYADTGEMATDANMTLTTNLANTGNTSSWVFGTDGRLTFPGTPRIDTATNNFEVQAAESINFEANAVVNIYTDAGNTTYQWQFGDDGNLIVPGNTAISTFNATGGSAGKNITIKAGAADQSDYYTTAGGNINITGGLGASNDGGGGGPGGDVNIASGLSADPAGHAGNVNITTGSKDWVFDYTGNLTVPGNIVYIGASPAPSINGFDSANFAGNVAGGNISTTGNITGNTNGYTIGYLNIPQVAASNTTIALSDAGKHYYSTTAGNLTLTIPNNATTSFATGTAISIVVQAAGNILVNAAGGVTLYMAGNSTAANRVVGGYGMATLMKVATDTWFINGTGVS